MLEIEFLGTGTSTGVPSIRCHCPVCMSDNPHDRRLRCSSIVRYHGKNLLIDCGPDFRQQILRASNDNLDALLITHIHYDHVGGIDDLRPYGFESIFSCYARNDVIHDLHLKMPYAFKKDLYPGAPRLNFVEIADAPFYVGDVLVEPIPVWHGKLLINGYRIGPLAYITDCKTIEPEQIDKIKNIPLLVINALHHREHHSHMNVREALEVVDKIKPGRTLFVHMSHQIGFHDEVNRHLPAGIQLAYDTQIVTVND